MEAPEMAYLFLLNTVLGHRPSTLLPEMIRLLADPALTPLADAVVNHGAQRFWLPQHTAAQWGLDALDPDGIAIRSIRPRTDGSVFWISVTASSC
jgi:haloalkane dehalogenase